MVNGIMCVRVGDKYTNEYVDRLHSMVKRHVTFDHEFVCLTESDLKYNLPGWWSKLELFNGEVTNKFDRMLYLDLDVVIVGNIDALMQQPGPFVILRDFWTPSIYNSSVMLIDRGFGQHIWDKFMSRSKVNMLSVRGDQEWISKCVDKAVIWQDVTPGLIGSYKADSLQNSPKGFSVVVFHGKPKPHEVGGWVKDAWI